MYYYYVNDYTYYSDATVFWLSYRSATVELKSLEAGGATFTIDSFNEFMFTRMALLVPAMHFQRLLQMRFCGRAFWKEQTKNRKRLHPEHNYVSIAHLLNPVNTKYHSFLPTHTYTFVL